MSVPTAKSAWLEAARKAMEIEAQAIVAASARLDPGLLRAVELMVRHTGKVVVSGLGKSGHVGRKIAATLQSTGFQAVFLHTYKTANEELSVYKKGDTVIMI